MVTNFAKLLWWTRISETRNQRYSIFVSWWTIYFIISLYAIFLCITKHSSFYEFELLMHVQMVYVLFSFFNYKNNRQPNANIVHSLTPFAWCAREFKFKKKTHAIQRWKITVNKTVINWFCLNFHPKLKLICKYSFVRLKLKM